MRSELEKKTPYNTYKIKGLTPTPIANPGRAAIEAVLNPAKTNDLYFVADGTGGHAFAPTLAKHNQNVTVWRRIERERREKEAAEKAAAEALASANSDQPYEAPAAQQPADAGGQGTLPILQGLLAETAPGGFSENIIEGLSIKLPPADGGVSNPVPETQAPALAPAPVGNANAVPPPRRKPKP